MIGELAPVLLRCVNLQKQNGHVHTVNDDESSPVVLARCSKQLPNEKNRIFLNICVFDHGCEVRTCITKSQRKHREEKIFKPCRSIIVRSPEAR